MRIVKMNRDISNHLNVVFDEIPELTYEKIGSDYVGSVTDKNGNVVFSNYLKYESNYHRNAFAGRTLYLKMKDGSETHIKDEWFCVGRYPAHGEFVWIGANTLDRLQTCFVFFSYHINKLSLENMISDYLREDRIYSYSELEEWARLSYEWFPVKLKHRTLPLLVNRKGDFIDSSTKKQVFAQKVVNLGLEKRKMLLFYTFDYKFWNGHRMERVQCRLKDVLKNSLPYSDEYIQKNLLKNGV